MIFANPKTSAGPIASSAIMPSKRKIPIRRPRRAPIADFRFAMLSAVATEGLKIPPFDVGTNDKYPSINAKQAQGAPLEKRWQSALRQKGQAQGQKPRKQGE
jgi:hypothetical protein